MESIGNVDGEEECIDTCEHCGRERVDGAPWYICAQCGVAGYCSRKHQRLGLSQHRSVCALPSCRATRGPEATRPLPAFEPDSKSVLATGSTTAPNCRTSILTDISPELQARIFRNLTVPSNLQRCRSLSCSLRNAVSDYTASVLRAPWWLLDARERALLSDIIALCPAFTVLQTACVCRSWHIASDDRTCFRYVRLPAFGWGLDSKMRALLRAMCRVATRAGLSSFPEDPPVEADPCRSPQARSSRLVHSAPCSPQSGPSRHVDLLSLSRSISSGLSLPTSPMSRMGKAAPSPLLLCRHSQLVEETGNIGSSYSQNSPEIWLLQNEEERWSADPFRRATCRWLGRHSDLLIGKSVLEMNAGAGLVGLFASRFAKSVTITTPTETSCRLARINAAMLLGNDKPSRLKWSGSTKQQVLSVPGRLGPVPVYVYTLQPSKRGIEALTRQWQWDSGTAMRGVQIFSVAPRFNVVVAADIFGSCASSGSGAKAEEAAKAMIDVANNLLADGGLFVATANADNDEALTLLSCRGQAEGFEVRYSEVMEDMEGGRVRVLALQCHCKDK